MNTYNYISINEILSRVTRHPLLKEVDKEQVINYLIDFLSLTGYSQFYITREDIIDIENYRGILPCEVVRVNFAQDLCSGTNLRSMTDIFLPSQDNRNDIKNLTFKLQGRFLYTSFKEGKVRISYDTVNTDSDGVPMLIDDPVFLKALELYIKKEVFTVLFDLNKINNNVLTHTESDYYKTMRQLDRHITTPDINEMETIKGFWTSIIQNDNHFYIGFSHLGVNDLIKK